MEWIKVCKDTPVKPELGLAARYANLTEAEAFLFWFRLYAWADSQTTNGWLPNLTLRDLAALTKTSVEFCDALASESIQWLLKVEASDKHPSGIQIAKWDRHNGKCAKRRAESARRMAKSRAGK